MKKNIIALAVAGVLAAPLAAQAEVTVSGQLQAEVTSLSADDEMKAIGITEGLFMHDAQEGGIPDKGTYGAVAVSASEDLGNGLKAIAKANFAINATEHKTNGIGGRDAYIGLSGGFGTVMAGTIATPYKSSTVKWDPFLATAGQARGNFGASTLHNGYAENVLAYANQFGPAKVVLAVSLDETDDKENGGNGDGETDGEHTTTASVNLPFGPVEVAFGYLNDDSTDDGTAIKLGAKYAAGPFGVSFQYEDLEAGLQNNILVDANGNPIPLLPAGTAVAADGETYILLNGTYTMGANTFALSYGMNEQNYVVAIPGVGTDEVTSDNTHLTFGMVHSFSKTTSAHVAYTQAEVDGEFGADGIAAGMRVKF